jgi:hypothetical protein
VTKVLSIILFIILLVPSFGLLDCPARVMYANDAETGQPALHTIHIINYAMHTGIIMVTDEAGGGGIQAASRFGGYRYIDIGWGDQEFYQGESSLYNAARAILVPTPSVVRIEGYNTSIRSMAPWCNYIVQLEINDKGFKELCNFIDDSFSLDKMDSVIIASVEREGRVIFFKSRLAYDLNNTCNTWVARALKKAGFKINPRGVRTAGTLFHRIRGLGTVIKSK